MLLSTNNNIAKPIGMDGLASALAAPLADVGMLMCDKDLRENIRTYLNMVPVLREMPKSISLDANVLAFNHTKANPAEGPCPTWDHFVNNAGPNGEALKAFVWAMLQEDIRLQQYLFLRGSGGDGKGSFVRWLNKLMGSASCALNAGDAHWPAACVGKRLGVFNDLNNTAVVMTSAFKQITGGDMVSVTQKYEKAYSAVLDTCFILTTNRSLSVISDPAERRRSISIEFPKPTEIIKDYERKLEAETQQFLYKCREAFNRLWDKDKFKIECDYEAFDNAAGSFEEEFEALFENNFKLNPDASTSATVFQSILRNLQKLDNRTISNFKEWLERTHGIKVRRVGSGPRCYRGLESLHPHLSSVKLAR
ncbi:MAG: hypothetical protein NVS1B10_07940 [Candidatus Saccharimonadales bacterium]